MPRRTHVRNVSGSGSSAPAKPRATPLSWANATALFIQEERLKGRRPRTLTLHREIFASTRADLDAIDAPNAPAAILRDHLARMVTHLQDQQRQPRTINLRLQSLRQLFAFLIARGECTDNPAMSILEQRESHHLPRALEDVQVEQLLHTCDRRSFIGLRDHTMIVVLLDTGIRLGELTQLEIDDLDLAEGHIKLRHHLKNHEERLVYVSAQTVRTLRAYLHERGDLPTSRIFVSRDETALSPASFQSRLQQYGKTIGVVVSPHRLRHTFARGYILNGGDPFSLQQILGHSDMSGIRTDGRFDHQVPGTNKSFDCRVSVVACRGMESGSGFNAPSCSIVIRLLDRASIRRLTDIMGPESRMTLLPLVRQPHGLVIFTGPMGSGKTTLVYSVLKTLDPKSIAIYTLEDPVEYHLPGIVQAQIDPSVGFTYESGAVGLARQDPNVILFGEIRDRSASRDALNLAMRGRLVLTTMHANSVPATISHLSGIDIEGYRIGSGVAGVVAQRLLPRLCEMYRKEIPAPEEFARLYELANSAKAPPVVYTNTEDRCRACNTTGFRGMTGIHEVFALTPRFAAAIERGSRGENELAAIALAEGYRPMIKDALQLVASGGVEWESVCRALGTRQVHVLEMRET